jgi:TolB protein
VPDGDSDRAEKITSGRYEGFDFTWTHDNRIVYVSGASGNADIWIMDRDGGNKKQLTSDPYGDFGPTITYDGRHIIFFSNRVSAPHIWKMDIDGSNQQQLTRGNGEWAPYCSPSGPWLIYVSSEAGKQNIYRLPVAGGEPVRLTTKYSYMPVISPDGKLIAYSYWDEGANPPQWGREIIPVEGGQEGKRFSLPSTVVRSQGAVLLRWMPDGRALTYVDNRGGIANVWSLPLDGGQPRQLTNFKDDRIFWFDWSRDGKHLAVTRGVETNDVVLINNFK